MASKIQQRHQNDPRPKIKVKIKKDDTVKVIAGKDKGKTGRVLDIDTTKGRVLIEGVGMIKRHGHARRLPHGRQDTRTRRQKGRRDSG